MSGANYIRHPSGRTRICSDDALEGMKSAGWRLEKRVEFEVVAEKPKPKKKKAPAKKAK